LEFTEFISEGWTGEPVNVYLDPQFQLPGWDKRPDVRAYLSMGEPMSNICLDPLSRHTVDDEQFSKAVHALLAHASTTTGVQPHYFTHLLFYARKQGLGWRIPDMGRWDHYQAYAEYVRSLKLEDEEPFLELATRLGENTEMEAVLSALDKDFLRFERLPALGEDRPVILGFGFDQEEKEGDTAVMRKAQQRAMFALECLFQHWGHAPDAHKDIIRSSTSKCLTGCAREKTPEKKQAPSVSEPSFSTKSQQAVFDEMTAQASTFFSMPDTQGLRIRPRFQPLLVGPTGVGKTHLVRRLAREQDAHYLRVCVSSWIPVGVRSGQGVPTAQMITEALAAHHRVVLHMDELDKLTKQPGEWGASNMAAIWDVLDRQLNPADTGKTYEQAKLARIAAGLESRLFIVGSGTWQSVFERSAAVGFTQGDSRAGASSDDIHKARQIPTELLARFNTNLLFLDYPDDRELQDIYRSSGLSDMAARLNYTLPATLDWPKGGFRILETLATDLCVRASASLGSNDTIELGELVEEIVVAAAICAPQGQ
jgi:hypothetical protein